MIIECLDDRFEQEGQQMYSNLQDLLMLAARNEDYDDKLKAILDFYKEDFNEDSLKSQLKTFSTIFRSLAFSYVPSYTSFHLHLHLLTVF